MYINSIGCYIPQERVHNNYFKDVNGLTNEWILQRTGIQTRSKAGVGENAHTMGLEAVENALKTLPYDIKEVDLVIYSGYTPLDTVGTLAHVVQKKYSIDDAVALYVSSACSSFVNALEIVQCYMAAGKSRKALVVCSEHNTMYSNESDPVSGHLWGDAAVAIFVSKERVATNEAKITDVYTKGLGHIGKGPDGVYLKPKSEGIVMPDGRDVFMNACKYMFQSINVLCERNSVSLDDVSKIICHQANIRIVDNVRSQLGFDSDKFLNNISELGNTGSVSSALVLAQNFTSFGAGDKIILTVFGGGYSCGASLITF